MKTLFLAWRDPHSRTWYPVGRLQLSGGNFEFVYVNGVRAAIEEGGFCPFPSFPELKAKYVSEELFPLFVNRLMPRSRPEYAHYIQWLSVPEDAEDPIALLSRSGGKRVTDTLEIFSCPERDEQGYYHIHFFAHGLPHMPDCSQQRAEHLQPGERLLLMHDFQNAYDPKALMLRTSEKEPGDIYNVGFCPRYLVDDIFQLLVQNTSALAEAITVRVERVNPAPAPTQFRLLCNMTMRWPDGFTPFSDDMYQPINTEGD